MHRPRTLDAQLPRHRIADGQATPPARQRLGLLQPSLPTGLPNAGLIVAATLRRMVQVRCSLLQPTAVFCRLLVWDRRRRSLGESGGETPPLFPATGYCKEQTGCDAAPVTFIGAKRTSMAGRGMSTPNAESLDSGSRGFPEYSETAK